MTPIIRVIRVCASSVSDTLISEKREMSKTTLTFELGGQVELKDLEKGITLFRRLVNNLTVRDGVTWVVEDLHPGSATVTLRGEADDQTKVERVIYDYEKIGSALSLHKTPNHAKIRVVKAAGAIADFVKSREYVRLGTPDQDYVIYGNGVSNANAPISLSVSIGAITGRVQTLSSRSGLRFNLYDPVHDRAITCYLGQGQEEIMREAWGNWATVVGSISRDPLTGKPISIRDIRTVERLDKFAPGTYREARGAVPWQPGDIMPEEAIRLLRDA